MVTFVYFKKVGLVYSGWELEPESPEPHNNFTQNRSRMKMMRLHNTGISSCV
jgi:hypothetical protein